MAVGTLGTPTVTDLGAARTMYQSSWTASSTGGVSGNGITVGARRLWQVTILPTTGGATQPTDAFDVTLLTADNLDLLNGAGADSTNGSPTSLQRDPPYVLEGATVYPTIQNAGDSKTGTVRIIVSE